MCTVVNIVYDVDISMLLTEAWTCLQLLLAVNTLRSAAVEPCSPMGSVHTLLLFPFLQSVTIDTLSLHAPD